MFMFFYIHLSNQPKSVPKIRGKAIVGTVSCKATLVVRQELGKNDNLIFNSFGTRQTLFRRVHVHV